MALLQHATGAFKCMLYLKAFALSPSSFLRNLKNVDFIDFLKVLEPLRIMNYLLKNKHVLIFI